MRRSVVLLFLLLLACALAAPAGARANAAQLSIMMDDDRLLYRGDRVRDDTMRQMKNLGADYVRVTVLWRAVADKARTTRARRRRFKADDPRTYPAQVWDRYDRLVQAGRTLNLGVFFNVTGPGPRWAHAKPPRRERKNRRTWKPKPREFFKFVKALGRRYDGTYVDENDGNRVLPRVVVWSLWNEPNQGGWLTPQYERGVPASPRLYRELFYYGRTALAATGHDNDFIMAGETAPLGSNGDSARSPMRPKRFIRELMCVDSRNQPYRGSSASRRGCSLFAKMPTLRYTAWAHHPYTKELAPTRRDAHRDSVTMANIDELTALLDQLGTATGRAPKINYSMLTEFGYETDPPDRYSGVSLLEQAEYINVGDYLAYRSARVFGNTQFLLRDVAPIRGARGKRRWFTYQSGLAFADGRPKPSARAYAMPFHLIGTGIGSGGQPVTRLWGQLRFFPNNVQTEVFVQFRALGSQLWETVGGAIPVSNGLNFWEAERPARGAGTWRAVWVDTYTNQTSFSREVEAR